MANKLYEEASVQAIADALRLKNDGGSNTYTVAEMNDAVLNMPFANIPSYHYAEAGRVVKRLLELKESNPKSIMFGTISDNHVDKKTTSAMTSVRHAVFALEYVGALAQCDFIANLGDNIAGNDGVDGESDYANAVYMKDSTHYGLSLLESFNLIGNHDKSSSTQRLFDLFGKYNNFDNYGTTQIRGYGYKDFTDKKVRVICLNTTDYWNAIGGNGMSYEQKDFFMKALDLSAKSDFASWTIIVLSHIPLDYLGGDYNKGADLKAILKAYNDGTTATILVDDDSARRQNESDRYSGTLTYSYTGKNLPKIINIHGHIHTNKYRKLIFIDDNTELNMWRIATPNSSFSGNASVNRYPSEGDYSITTDEAREIEKGANSKADTSATFYLVDLDKQTVHCVGYGADIDRTVVYKGGTYYSITYNLTGATSSYTGATAEENSFFKTIIRVDEGFTLNSVKVTMGGVDVTSSVYEASTNNIIIEEVTGNVVITVTAIVEVSYTNIIDTVGTEDNVRLRSGGATGSAAGFASNYFPVKAGDVIRVYFPNGNRASIPSNGVYCCLYSNTSGTLVAAYDGSTSSSVLKNTTDKGYEIHIPTSANCSYARVAGGPNGAYAGWIVTVNEEIA